MLINSLCCCLRAPDCYHEELERVYLEDGQDFPMTDQETKKKVVALKKDRSASRQVAQVNGKPSSLCHTSVS